MNRPLALSYLFVALTMASGVRADEWPQWMGPQRDGVWRESGIVDVLPTNGPDIVWRAPVAGGYAGPAVADGKVFVMDYRRREGEPTNDPGIRPDVVGDERVLCLDAATGEQIWVHAYDCPYQISYPAGPRVTPTVDGDRLYTLGAEGRLLCLQVADGQVVWSKDLQDAYKFRVPTWGCCGHPLVHGDKLLCVVGGKGSVAVAFDSARDRNCGAPFQPVSPAIVRRR